MVNEIVGDLLIDGRGILCHQTNYDGIKGAGIALHIKNRLMTKKQFEEYRKLCDLRGEMLLGTVQFMRLRDGRYLANCFSEVKGDRSGVDTKYDKLVLCFKAVNSYAKAQGLPVSLPARIGCGIAGGHWPTVKQMIYDVFDDDVDVTIVSLT